MYAYYKNTFRDNRIQHEQLIPKIPLHEKNINNCQIVLNRQALLSKLKSNGIVAEIGVDTGEFSALIKEKTHPSVFHLIDIWGSERYDTRKYNYVLERFEKQIKNGEVIVHRKRSLEAVNDFTDYYFNWIYIDTVHNYETTRDELKAYSNKVKHDGIIAGHDYTMGGYVEEVRVGVIEAVHEFCVEHNWEIVYLTIDPIEKQSFAIKRIN